MGCRLSDFANSLSFLPNVDNAPAPYSGKLPAIDGPKPCPTPFSLSLIHIFTRSKPLRDTASAPPTLRLMEPCVPNEMLLPTSSRLPARTVKPPAPTPGASPNSTRGRSMPLVIDVYKRQPQHLAGRTQGIERVRGDGHARARQGRRLPRTQDFQAATAHVHGCLLYTSRCV